MNINVILGQSSFTPTCLLDMNNDYLIDILDIVVLVDLILDN